jgi:predicted amidohydrolase
VIPERYASYEKTVTVGAVNFTPLPGDKPANLAKIEASVREAAAQGIDLLVFPEEALIGCGDCPVCRSGAPHCAHHQELAETVPGPSTERIAQLAREHDMTVVFGLAERDPEHPEILYNAAAVVGPDGIQGTYRKLHLGSLPWVSEGVTFRPGNALPVFETRFGPIGVLICYDFWFNPELARILALKGARLILNCAATFKGPGKRDYMVHTTATRAQENLCYAVTANQVGGPDGTGSYGAERLDEARTADFLGHSLIAGPAFPRFSQVYAEAGDTEELVSATLSFEKLHRWESVFPWRDWRANHQSATSELVADEFRKLIHGS